MKDISKANRTRTETSPRAGGSQRPVVWFALAVGSLIIAGLFSLLLILGRMPPFSQWLPYPAFFRRCLVVHVDLALIIWFYAFVAGLLQFLPMKAGSSVVGRSAPIFSVTGTAMMIGTALIPGAEPVLVNYVPVLDHPLFLIGLGLFAVGILLTVVSARYSPEASSGLPGSSFPPAAVYGLKAAAVAILTALVTFAAAWSVTPFELAREAYFEFLFWGGGHVLQVASVCAMVSVWLILLSSKLERPVIGAVPAAILFAWLVLPHLASPFLALHGTETGLYRTGATRLMEFGIFPPVTIFLVWLLIETRKVASRRDKKSRFWSDPRIVGFSTSAGLTIVGFGLGASIGSSSTTIPAHYHASIGAVTVAFMTFGLHVREVLRLPFKHRRLRKIAPWQPLLFGAGQIVFACGFALAGASGMGRKLFGPEQLIQGWTDFLGLVVMGVGGIVAISGGLLFIILAVDAALGRISKASMPATAMFLRTPTGGPDDV